MSSDWRTGRLGDFIELKRGYDLPQAKRTHGSIPLVSSSGITDSHQVAMVKGPGVITGRYGTIGQVFYVEGDFWPLNTTLYVRDFKGNHPKFIHYFLKTVDFLAYSDKAAVPGVNRNHLHEALAVMPPLQIQKVVADFLGHLDDRIALIRETNATLEGIAQALFKSWFVGFDPIRAKQQGLKPEGMDEAMAALFPDHFAESELGLVPKGWNVGTLSDLVVTSRKQLQPSDLHAELKYVGLEHIPRKSLALTAWDTADGLESAKAAFNKGDILFGKLRPYFHKVVVAPFDGVCSTDILVCQPQQPEYQALVAMLLSSVALIDYADRLSNGAKMPRVTWKDLAAYPVVRPPQLIAAQYNRVVLPLQEKIMANVLKAQTLATLRDTLLPRLISGQLSLPDDSLVESEAILEEAA
jgi:type I restriction enzyme S subunit